MFKHLKNSKQKIHCAALNYIGKPCNLPEDNILGVQLSIKFYISSSESITIDRILLERIKGEFANLTMKVRKNLTISVDDLCGYLTSLFGCGDFISSISTVSEMIDDVTQKQSWDYYNYHALEEIINHFGSKEMKGGI